MSNEQTHPLHGTDKKIIDKMVCVDGKTKKAEKYMFNSL